jgi:hypothetical protein
VRPTRRGAARLLALLASAGVHVMTCTRSTVCTLAAPAHAATYCASLRCDLHSYNGRWIRILLSDLYGDEAHEGTKRILQLVRRGDANDVLFDSVERCDARVQLSTVVSARSCALVCAGTRSRILSLSSCALYRIPLLVPLLPVHSPSLCALSTCTSTAVTRFVPTCFAQ